jgi:hypothetical protein
MVLLVLGVAPRLFWIALAPTQPVSDFHALIEFATTLQRDGLRATGPAWFGANPGMPSLLALIFAISLASPVATARVATALVGGLLPLLPFLIWRDVLSLRTRVIAGLLLALWPQQILFAGVLAQDNWVLFPTVALGALAVRALRRDEPRPVAAALLLFWAGATRQEMWLALAPLAVAAVGIRRPRALLVFAAVFALGLGALGAARARATGKFGLTTHHAGVTLLGSWQPGVEGHWAEPYTFLAGRDPSALDDLGAVDRLAARAALDEALRRPGFHTARIAASTLRALGRGEILFWAFDAAGALTDGQRARARPVADALFFADDAWLLAIHGAFFAALAIGLWRRSRAVLVLAAAIALKIFIHVLMVLFARFFLAVTALEVLAIAAVLDEDWPALSRCARVAALAIAAVAAIAIGFAEEPANAWVRRHDEPMTGRAFHLRDAAGADLLTCRVLDGRLFSDATSAIAFREVDLRTRREPNPGEGAAIACRYHGPPGSQPVLQLSDELAAERPGHLEQRVLSDGKLLWSHDVGAGTFRGWSDVPFDPAQPLTIVLVPRAPEPGAGWGDLAATHLRLR